MLPPAPDLKSLSISFRFLLYVLNPAFYVGNRPPGTISADWMKPEKKRLYKPCIQSRNGRKAFVLDVRKSQMQVPLHEHLAFSLHPFEALMEWAQHGVTVSSFPASSV